MKILWAVMLSIFFLFTLPAALPAQGIEETVREFIQKAIQEKTQLSGTFDLFDEENNKVRNLRLVEGPLGLNSQEGIHRMKAMFKDIKSGDSVELEFKVQEKEGILQDLNWQITKTEMAQLQKPPRDNEEKVFGREDVQKALENYIFQKSKFTKTFDIFDTEITKMRKLEFVSFDDELRHFGILYILAAHFKDKGSQEMVKVDFTAENQGNSLAVKIVKIVEVQKQ